MVMRVTGFSHAVLSSSKQEDTSSINEHMSANENIFFFILMNFNGLTSIDINNLDDGAVGFFQHIETLCNSLCVYLIESF